MLHTFRVEEMRDGAEYNPMVLFWSRLFSYRPEIYAVNATMNCACIVLSTFTSCYRTMDPVFSEVAYGALGMTRRTAFLVTLDCSH